MHVCYLDFDGVLHYSSVWLKPDQSIEFDTSGRRLFEWEPILLELLAPHPHVKIVLSTSWVRVKGLDYAKGRLDLLIRSRVIGATSDSWLPTAEDFALQTRGMQIWENVQRSALSDWFAIDDDGFGLPDWAKDKLVKTKGAFGLSECAVQEEIRWHLGSLTSLVMIFRRGPNRARSLRQRQSAPMKRSRGRQHFRLGADWALERVMRRFGELP